MNSEDPQERRLATTQPPLFVLDGSKPQHTAALRLWGQNAVIQRYQVHKKPNLEAHIPEKPQPELEQRLGAADQSLTQRRGIRLRAVA